MTVQCFRNQTIIIVIIIIIPWRYLGSPSNPDKPGDVGTMVLMMFIHEMKTLRRLRMSSDV